MSGEVLSVTVMVRLAVTDAPECVAWTEGETYVPTEVVWSVRYHRGRVWPVAVQSTTGDLTTHYGDLGDPIPDWVPRPPAGWDASLAVIS